MFTSAIFNFNCLTLKLIEKIGNLYFSNNSSPILKNEKSWIFNFFAMKILSLPVNLQVEKESLHAEEEAAATLLSRSAVQQFFSVESEFLLSWYVWCSVPFSLRHTVLKNMLASRLQQQQHWSFYSIFWTQLKLFYLGRKCSRAILNWGWINRCTHNKIRTH